ncbi:MAG: LytTR family transcriptional regulator [Ruminococcaceae bacterium]|nr:LytTR family transcriptional regulator [Oscillospiraceae bacterium]
MKCTTVIDKNREEEVIIYLREENKISAEIEELIAKRETRLLGYDSDSIVALAPEDVTCFTTEEGRVFALLDNGRLRVKLRLYEIEEARYSDFVKINQSCIANISKMKKLDVSLGGALRVEFKNGYRDYVSRRQLKAVKERLGIK